MTERLKVLHLIPSLSPKHGGPTYAVWAIARALKGADVDVTIATTDDDGNDTRLRVPIGEPVKEEAATIYYFRRDILPYKISFGLARWLRSNVSKFDIVHVHALFSFNSSVAAHTAHWQGVPYVVRPLGVLNRYGLENRRPLLKKITMPLLEFRILRHSAAIHYTSEAEKREAGAISREIAAHQSVVIPLPVERTKADADKFRRRFPQVGDQRIILFLSRIDEKKGIELLLEAFADVSREVKDLILVVAGDGLHDYTDRLRSRAKELQVDDRIVWTGHLNGELKLAAFAAAEVFALPSYSENFGIAAAEAIASGVPTIISNRVAISEDIRANNAGLIVTTSANDLASAMRQLLADRELAGRLANNARQLAAQHYAPSVVGRQLRHLYDSILSERK